MKRKRRINGSIKSRKAAGSSRFLEVSFGVSRSGHPEIYNFFLQDIGPLLAHLKQPRAQVFFERLEPLNTAYSHLKVSNTILQQVFRRFCKSHHLKPYSAFSQKEHFSCKGVVQSQRLLEVLEDYNLLFDVFFCDIRLQTKKLFIDAMDLFSNRILVRSDLKTLKAFQQSVKKNLPHTKFRLV